MSSFKITYPPELPVSAERERILALLAQHQVLIVCGETGSGKTTQLPKMLLEMGLGAPQVIGEKPRLIGHTQPRRIATTSVAKRVAEELQTPLGETVGYQVRFSERLSESLRIKLMTDGILLAETQRDPLFRKYAAIIIDEAHERSLNIDFLLGYIHTLLPKRPDLKLIITSATIDAERFAQRFAQNGQAAPILNVQGRNYPVEMRYRPVEDYPQGGIELALTEAIGELWRNPSEQDGVLVFLSGERAIRDAADHLRGHFAGIPNLRDVQILPLFSRLSQAEQEQIFSPRGQRRVVLATNIAETSLTVPGIRYVIDSGQARVKRYSYRNKVELLRVEAISQAAANQRAGRSGRLAPGVCIRLYSEEDFAGRAAFTDPEVLRASLAAVILRMQSLRLGQVEDFPFIDAPPGRAIADGYQTLSELGALTDSGALTAIGNELAQIPLDPRFGRMLIEARKRNALSEMLVLTSALSLQDVRDRPLEQQEKADAAHALWVDEKSEFSSLLQLWDWIEKARGSGEKSLSRKQWEQQLRSKFLNVRRVREWRETHAQLCKTIQSLRCKAWHSSSLQRGDQSHRAKANQKNSNSKPNDTPNNTSNNKPSTQIRQQPKSQNLSMTATGASAQNTQTRSVQAASYEQLHISILSGLLGNIGYKREDTTSSEYLGSRGIRFLIHPSVRFKRKQAARWVMAAELVETSRLFGRCVAQIDPAWVEQIAPQLIARQVGDPHWEKKASKVMALARGSLYGLPIYQQRKCDFAQVDMAQAREIFIREALVAGTLGEDVWPSQMATQWPFWQHNCALLRTVQAIEHKQRRQDVLVDETLIYAFFDAHIPPDIASGIAFSTWYKQARAANAQTLFLRKDELMRHEAVGITSEAFPPLIRLNSVDCKASYLHALGDIKDGVSVDVPLFALNQVQDESAQWLVPGMLGEKVAALLKSLPQRPRSRLQPLANSAKQATAVLQKPERFGQGSLLQVLADWVYEATGFRVHSNDFRLEALPKHCLMYFRVLDDNGRQLGVGRNLPKLQAEFGQAARGAFSALAQMAVARQSKAPAPGPDQTLHQTSHQKPNQAHSSGSKTRAESAFSHLDAMASAAKTAKNSMSKALNNQGQASGSNTPSNTPSAGIADRLFTTWDFGDLPEIMEIERHGHTLLGYPALIEAEEGVRIEVFDDPKIAQKQHQKGLLRLLSWQIKDALKYLEKNIPNLQGMALAYLPLGNAEELRAQIIELSLQRAFLSADLPSDADSFAKMVQDGRPRLNLIATEIARLCEQILSVYQAVLRKTKDGKLPTAVGQDMRGQIQRLMPKRFLLETPWQQLQHFPRYFQAIEKRLEKCKSNPERDANIMREVQQQEARYARAFAVQKGVDNPRLESLRWMIEELRVGLFAQELKTPHPVSSKRLEKLWAQLGYL